MKEIISGDALDELKKLDESSVDLVLTDPPYNVGYSYNSYKDELNDEDYLEWQLDTLRECERVLKQDGSLFYLNYPEFNSKIWCALQEDFDLKPIELIAWIYHSHNGGKPLRKGFRTWVWASKGQPKNDFFGEYKNPTDKRVAKLIADGKKAGEYDWWHIEQVKNVSKDKTEHTTQLPEKMVAKIINATTEQGGVVLDPFLGSGTVTAVANKLGRGYIGIEIDEKYVGIAKHRTENAVGML